MPIVWLLMAATVHGQAAAPARPNAQAAAPDTPSAQKNTVIAAPIPVNGAPPPAGAMALSVPQARDAMREAIKTTFVGPIKTCLLCSLAVLSPVTDFRLSSSGFSYGVAATVNNEPFPVHVSADFKKLGYVQAYKISSYSCSNGGCYTVGFLPKPNARAASSFSIEWSDETTAQSFAEAVNRLVYSALSSEGENDFASFSTAAKAWRENPAKPPLGPEADRHRILAENAIKEKDLESAIDHYESAVEVQPMWPEGWFNLALLYAEQNDFADAADRIKHYLELVPDAPDAQAARTNMIIWEDKTNK